MNIRGFKISRLNASKCLGTLLIITTVWAPMSVDASVVVFANGTDISQKGSGGVAIAWPDVSRTPCSDPSICSLVPIPYPVTNTSVTDTKTKQTKITTKVVIKSEKFSKISGDEGGLRTGIFSSKNLGLIGDTIQFSWDIFVHSEETASLSILLADPATGQSFGPGYSVDVTDTQTGSVSFDIANAPLTEFDIILIAIQTAVEPLPRSRLALTDFAIDGVSVADQFSVSLIPIPAAFWLFGTALIGLVGFSKRRKAA